MDGDCFSLYGSGWEPLKDETRTSRIWLLAQATQESNESSVSTTSALGITGALGVALALGVYARKRMHANRADTDEFIRA